MVVKNFHIWKKFPRSGRKNFAFIKYFPCLHNGSCAYNDIYIPIESVLMGDSESSHSCQNFPNLEKNFTIVKYFPCLHNGLHAYDIYVPIKSVLMDDDEFSHGCQKFLHLEKNSHAPDQKISTFVKYFPCLHNTFHRYKSTCILKWKHFDGRVQIFPWLSKIPTLQKTFEYIKISHSYKISSMPIKAYAYPNEGVLIGEGEFSHYNKDFHTLEKNFHIFKLLLQNIFYTSIF